MRKPNAFTLIELLAVVTILTILSIIITPIIDTKIKSSKDKMYKVQIENIRMAGEAYYSDNMMLKPQEDLYSSISLTQLISEGYIGGNIKDPKTGNILDGQLTVQIQNNSSTYEYYVCPIEQECK